MIDHLCGFPGTGNPVCRYLLPDHVFFFFGESGVHFCVNHAERYCVHGDIAGGNLFCQGFRKRIDSAFGGRVQHLTGGACAAPYGRYVEDRTGLPADHMRKDTFAGGKQRHHIGVEHFLPVFFRGISKQTHPGNTCIIHKAVQPSETGDSSCYHLFHKIGITDIACKRKTLDTQPFDLLFKRCEAFGMTVTVDGHIPAVLGKDQSRFSADASGTACDEYCIHSFSSWI